jgi:polyisoprenoid-binding protein YceI
MAWQIDTVHTHVGFRVKHLMVSTVRGQFKKYSGTVNIDPADFTKSTIEGSVEVASIDTDNKDRDAHLRTGDFFDAANHPLITFKSKRIQAKDGAEFVVSGDLTIRGVTKEVAFDVEFNGVAKSPYGQIATGLSAKASLNRNDFGVSFNAPLETGGFIVGEKVFLELELEATQVADAAGVAKPALAVQAAA